MEPKRVNQETEHLQRLTMRYLLCLILSGITGVMCVRLGTIVRGSLRSSPKAAVRQTP